jgi:hypothetical protein
MDEWKSAKLPSGTKLFRVHNFNLIHSGVNYILEVDEYSDGTFTGHGEHSTDKNYVIQSVSATSMKKCVEALVQKIQDRH